MRRITHIILFLTLSIELSGQGLVQFDPNQFQREATDQVLEQIESTVMEKIEMAIAAGEKQLTKAIYLQDVLEPLRSYGIDPEKEGYYKDLQSFYEEYTSNPDFDPRAGVQDAFTGMIKTKITGEIYAIIGKENIEMAGELQTIFTNASEKVTSILEALESVSHIEDVEERQSEFRKAAKRIGLTGRFFEAVGDLEIVIGGAVDRVSEPLQIVTAIVNATAESNPTNKIKMLFDFGETYGGKIPVVGDIVQALFTVGKKLIEAAEMAGGLIESNVDQNCIHADGNHNYAGNSKKESFVQSHPGVSICPLRNKGVYTNIYVNQDNYRQIYFYVDGQWIDGQVDKSHKGGDDIFALVQWLRGNGFTNEAVDLKFLSKAYNNKYGFRHFRDIRVRGKLVEIAKLSKSIINKLDRCDDEELEKFFDEEIGFSYLDVSMQKYGGFKLVDIDVMSSNIEEITDEIIIWRYIYNTLSHVESLEDIYQNLLVSQPVRIYGKIKDGNGKVLGNAKVQSSGQGIVFLRNTNCDKSTSNGNGGYSFFYIPTTRSQNVISFIARYEGIVEKGEILMNGVANNFELNFEFNLGKEEDQLEVDKDGDGFNIKEDCNDGDASINPDALEIKDNDIDENCDGIIEYSSSADDTGKEIQGQLIIIPLTKTIFIDEEVTLRAYWEGEDGERKEVTEEALISNPFKSKRTGEFKVRARFEGLEATAVITVEKDERKCKDENEVWNEDLAVCQCKKGYTRNDEGSCIPLSEFNDREINNCLNEHEVWNEDLLLCECEKGYKRNANGKCVEIVEGNDPSGNINECLNEHEVWNEDLLLCECEKGYKRNANGKCVEIVEGNDPSGNINECLNEHEVWNEDLLLCECEEGYKRNANGKCVEIVEGNDPSGNINECLNEHEVWNEDLLLCECEKGYKRNANGKCVEIVEGNDPSGNLNECLNEHEVWNEDLLLCECEKGYKRNANGKCVEIVEGNDPSGNLNECLNEHEVWNEDLLLCECEEGYKRNANGKCVEIVEGNDPSGNLNECLRENEIWNSTTLECECIPGYKRDALGVCIESGSGVSCGCPKGQVCDAEGNCIPLEDAITMAEEGIEKDCPDFNEVEVNLRALISQHRSIEYQITNYIRKFEKEINDRAAIPCENKLLGFTYYSVYALLDRLYQIENELGDIYFSQISYFSLSGQCPDFSNAMTAVGLDNSFISNELKKYQILNERVGDLDALLIENGCDPEVVIQEGQTIQPPGSDPDFIDNGGTSTEIDGDGKDNDGDGQQDEIPVQGLPGYNVTIVVYDSGSGKDDIFGLSIGGQGFLGNSPKGGLRSYGLNLPPGNYSGTLEVVLAADDIGTYTINILHRQENIYFDTGDPPEGTRIPFSFEIIE